MKMKIKISPDGKLIEGLYSDKFPWMKLGSLNVTRASDVFFDEESQSWKIRLSRTKQLLPVHFSRREDAIAYERGFLEEYDFT
jgi:hypothetical protein